MPETIRLQARAAAYPLVKAFSQKSAKTVE